MITTLALATSHLFLSFDISCYKLSHTCTHLHLFFLLSTFYLSMATPYILLFLWMNEWMCVFISERVRVWTKYKECCCVTLVFRTSLTEESKVLLWLALSLPLYKWNVVSFSTSTCSTVQLQNSILHSFFAFVSKTCVYFNLLRQAFGINLTIYFSVLFRNIFCLSDDICSLLIWKTH